MRFFLVFLFLLTAAPVWAADLEYVVLLHGLARTSRCMEDMAAYFSEHGYQVLNIDYPSRKHTVSQLAEMVRKEITVKTACSYKIHFVTHSMGGIILRYIQKHAPIPNIGRVVMLSPPNGGSQVVDKLGDTWLFNIINGPAGSQLSTRKNGLCQTIGPVNFDLGVITGDWSINWINSLMIPGDDDGKVSIESAKVAGMADYLIVHATHPLIMQNKIVMAQCLHFIRNGHFNKDTHLTF